jgi:hypothetical protein
MPNPNQAIIPGVLPGEPVPENEDLQPGQKPHFGERDPDSKDGMPNSPDVPIPVPGDI